MSMTVRVCGPQARLDPEEYTGVSCIYTTADDDDAKNNRGILFVSIFDNYLLVELEAGYKIDDDRDGDGSLWVVMADPLEEYDTEEISDEEWDSLLKYAEEAPL